MESYRNGIKSVMKNAETAPVEDQTVKDFPALKHPKFEVYADKSCRFRLKAANGQEILSSQPCKEKSSCENGIASVVRNAKNAPTVIEKPGCAE